MTDNPKDTEYDAVADIAELRGRANLVQLHVKLIPPARNALNRLMHVTRLSKTDVTNRAIQIYDFIEDQKAMGGELLIRRGDKLHEVHIV